MRPTPSKYWCFTSDDDDEPPYTDDMSYLITGRGTCPDTGNVRWECYCELKTKKRMSYFKEHDYYKHVLPEARKGTALEASDRLKKEHDCKEIGIISKPNPGARNDIRTAVLPMQGGISPQHGLDCQNTLFNTKLYGKILSLHYNFKPPVNK